MGLPRITIQSVLKSGVEAPKKLAGRQSAITDKTRARLIACATLKAAHQRMPHIEIARLGGVQAGRKALIAALNMEAYGRRVATKKPMPTYAQKQARLT
jgi:hypothetical protein